jgi:hypothetical protein
MIGNSPMHTYQPGMLFLPFQTSGYKTADYIGKEINYVSETIQPGIRSWTGWSVRFLGQGITTLTQSPGAI